MKFLFKYATRSRPQIFKQIIQTYVSLFSNNHEYQWIISADTDDATMNNEMIKGFVKQIPNASIFYAAHQNKIEAINADMEKASDFDILFVVSDDMRPQEKGFDDIIAKDMMYYFPNLDGALHYNDGCCGKDKTITLSIMGKKLYDYFGYIYHPDYKSFYCDNEFTEVVKSLNKHVYIDRVVVKHEYKGFKMGADSLYQTNSKKGREDSAIFARRKAAGFPK